MLYVLFLVIAIAYNIRKFSREREDFLKSIIDATEPNHREMILAHHFHIYIFESFISIIVAHLISEGSFELNLVGVGIMYLALLALGFVLYQSFLKYVERKTNLVLRRSFNQHVIKEFRISFALIMLPVLLYSVINWAFSDNMEEWGNYWFVGVLSNIVFVSVLTILCTVIIMLHLIPNRKITEIEYLSIINKRLAQIGMPHMRVRWIESDIKNAFVVGMKLLKFSNQTMFVGKGLRTMLTMEEFDAVIAHELAHVANRHIQKRVIELLKNFISGIMGLLLISLTVIGVLFLYHGEDIYVHMGSTAAIFTAFALGWFFFNYALFFDAIRSHEYEADAYAVMNMGANQEALNSALVKLTENQMPEYLKGKIKTGPKNNWFHKAFSTHPSLEERSRFLAFKIDNDFAFNYYVSTAQRIRNQMGRLLQWKISVPATIGIGILVMQTVFSLQEGKGLIAMIKSADSSVLRSDLLLARRINDRPLIIGPTLMYDIVKRGDPELIEHFVKIGAEKGRTLYYLSKDKNFELFTKFYVSFQKDLSEDEYFLILRNTAEVGFTEGYRLMVNSTKFDDLNPGYKADITRIHQNKKREPASVEP